MVAKYGVLASALTVIDETVAIYTCPAGKYAVANISITNAGQGAADVSVAVTTGETPEISPLSSQWIEHELPLDPREGVERAGIMLGEGNAIFVRANSASLTVNVFGIENNAT